MAINRTEEDPTPTIVASGGEDCCCEEDGECSICGRTDYPYATHPPDLTHFLESWINTVTSVTGDVAHWFTEGSYEGGGVVTLPYDFPIPFTYSDQEFCGFSGNLSMTAFCCNNKVGVYYGNTFMVFGDCSTFTTNQCGISDPDCLGDCNESTFQGQFGQGKATIVMGEEVCDEDGFVSVDYTVTLAFGEGTINGTIHRP